MSMDGFKSFIKGKPNLAKYVNNGQMTWQKFYEMYDLYGDDSKVWDEYIDDRKDFKINELFKNIDINSIKEHIGTAQKALSFVQELTSKDEIKDVAKAVEKPRPLNKFFED